MQLLFLIFFLANVQTTNPFNVAKLHVQIRMKLKKQNNWCNVHFLQVLNPSMPWLMPHLVRYCDFCSLWKSNLSMFSVELPFVESFFLVSSGWTIVPIMLYFMCANKHNAEKMERLLQWSLLSSFIPIHAFIDVVFTVIFAPCKN